MPIVVVGLSHKTARLEIRERVALSSAQQDALLRDLQTWADERVILSTCNRLEIYAAGDRMDSGTDPISDLLGRFGGFPSGALGAYLYRLEGAGAVSHLFAVAAGLDSMILGEPQILGQVRSAYARAAACHAVGPILSRAFHHALRAGKLARSSTRIDQHAASISHAVLQMARGALGDLTDRSVLVVGTGEVGQLIARAVRVHGVRDVVTVNRTYSRAARLAERIGSRVASVEKLPELLVAADLVVASTDSPHHVLTRHLVEEAASHRAHRPLLVIDVSVPRNVDPSVQGLDGVRLYNIDALKRRCQMGMDERRREVNRAREVLRGEMAAFLTWWASRQVVPTISALRQQAEEIRRAELEKALTRMGGLSEQQRSTLESLTAAIVNKILHQPTVRLKNEAVEGKGIESAAVLRRLFGLGEDGERRGGD